MALFTILTLITDTLNKGYDTLHRGLRELLSCFKASTILGDQSHLDSEDKNNIGLSTHGSFSKSLLKMLNLTTFRFFERTRRFSTAFLDQITDSSQKEWLFLIRRMKVNFGTLCEDFIASFELGDDRESTPIERFESLLLSFIAMRMKCHQNFQSKREFINLIYSHHAELKAQLDLSIEYLFLAILPNFGFFTFCAVDSRDMLQLQFHIEENIHVAKSFLLRKRQELGVTSKILEVVENENDLVFRARRKVVEEYLTELSLSIGKVKNALETLIDVWNMLLGFEYLRNTAINMQRRSKVEEIIVNVRAVFKEMRIESNVKCRVESWTYSYMNGGLNDPGDTLGGYFRRISHLENTLEQGMNDADVLIQSILRKLY